MLNIYTKLPLPKSLLLHVDGGCQPKNPGGVVTAGWVIYNKETNETLVEESKVIRDGGPEATNNFGEYSSLGLALTYLKNQKWKGNITIKADSKLLVEQVNNRWKCKVSHLIELRQKIWELLQDLSLELTNEQTCELIHVRREFNKRPDELCRLAYEEYSSNKKETK